MASPSSSPASPADDKEAAASRPRYIVPGTNVGVHSPEYLRIAKAMLANEKLPPLMRVSVSKLAQREGVTKNVISGLRLRLGLADPERHPARVNRRKAEQARRERAVLASRGEVPKPPQEGEMSVQRKTPASIAGLQPVVARSTLTAIAPFDTCQYIRGEGPPWSDDMKCGRPSVEGFSYCAEHKARCYEKRVRRRTPVDEGDAPDARDEV